ncbi:MAG: DinB family protein [Anaerolineae bacterium]|nr:DinB family protein [Anaerolineae bacterium]
MIDFSPVDKGEMKILEFSRSFSAEDLKRVTAESIDFMLALIADLDDAAVTFDPIDPEANDPFAKPGEEKIGWSLAHLIAHVTASSEENAAYASILARGIAYPAEPRLRYETPWQDLTTQAQCVQRLEESRRLRLGYLAAMPDQPDLVTLRGLSPRYVERFGDMNAFASLLFGLWHEVGHHAQMQEVRRQALAARA